jgi:alpha-galactosidase
LLNHRSSSLQLVPFFPTSNTFSYHENIMKRVQMIALVAILLCGLRLTVDAQTLWLDELNLGAMTIGWGTPEQNRSVEGHRLSIAGESFDRGIGTHAISTFPLHLAGKGRRFRAMVGVDDEAAEKASVAFYVVADGKVVWESGTMKKGDLARNVDIDVSRVALLGLLVTDAGDGIDYDHADWVNARIEMAAPLAPGKLTAPAVKQMPRILTPRPSDKPRINSAKVFGVRPGNPFLYTIAATGRRPMTFSARNLPPGLSLDQKTGCITGVLKHRGDYTVTLVAGNVLGIAERELLIIAGDDIALTPPMGWNSWNCWAEAVDDAKVRAAADAMVASGLMDHGWTYINIDDCWMVKPDAEEPTQRGEPRDANGAINTNAKFPNMRALSEYIHSKGMKLGIYSGPGPLTCAGYTGSYQHEQQDARRYGEWGIDYLKYDWCSYSRIAKDKSLPELKKPYAIMRAALDSVRRDIIYSLCQYGWGDVWEWGAEVGGNCWRTTGDITDTWASMAGIGFGEAGHEDFARPGNWNDPDMLVVGQVGWGPSLHPTRLTPDEQYTHISLWSLLAAPLLIGCDMSRMDDFTLSLLTNDEVIAVNQDPLGRQAKRVYNHNGDQVWVKELEDGSKAVGLFYVGGEKKKPTDYFAKPDPRGRTITVRASAIGVTGKFSLRDLWRQKDLGIGERKISATVPYHGVVLLRVKKTSKEI